MTRWSSGERYPLAPATPAASTAARVGAARHRRRPAVQRAVGLGALALALLSSGCEDLGAGVVACDRPATAEPLLYTGGSVEDGVYMSSPWDGELIYFPGGAWYEVRHQLGQVPRLLQFYLSFERQGVAAGSLALASGNQVEIKAISPETVTVLNGSCVDYWLLVVAGEGSAGAAP